MGCDIHLHFEKKTKEGLWEAIDIPNHLVPDGRDYDIFYFLAGVRQPYGATYNPQFPDRGMPDGCTYSFTGHFRDYGYHSPTYASLDEIIKAPWKKANLDACYFPIFCEHVLPRFLDWFDKNENVRVVMWFDN